MFIDLLKNEVGIPWSVSFLLFASGFSCVGSKDNRLQVVELSGQPDLQIVVNISLHTVSSTVSGPESVSSG